MSNERTPLLSDELVKSRAQMLSSCDEDIEAVEDGINYSRSYYETLIYLGKLRVVEHASPVHKLSGLLCSICGISWQDDQYCRGCGNKIKHI